MPEHLDRISQFVDAIAEMQELLLANLVLIGQIPSSTFKEGDRASVFLERMADFQVDECTSDGYGNPLGIVRGTSPTRPPIFVVAHLDTYFDSDTEFNYRILENTVEGPGVTDNSLGVAVLATLPEIFRRLDLRFESDIVLAGVIQSMGRGNLRGIRHLLNTWPTPIRGAICVEGVELGRLNYYSDGMMRVEVACHIGTADGWEHPYRPNAILVLNEVINQVLQLRLPQRPRSRVIFGRFAGGLKHGIIAYDATLGMEIQSDDDQMVKSIYSDIRDIVHGTSHEYGVDLKLTTISNVGAARLRYNHPLVKASVDIINALGIKPVSTSSESELSIFLSRKIPAITLGLTHGEDYHLDSARLEIAPVFKGVAQVVAAIMAIDRGVCDEIPLD